MKASARDVGYLVVTIVLSVVIVAVLVVRAQTTNAPSQEGSVSSPRTTGTPSATAVASMPASPTANSTAGTLSGCGSNSQGELSIDDGASPTVAHRTHASQMVAVGTVTSIGSARWNTPNGSAPTFSQGHPPAWALIYRPVTLSIQETAKGVGVATLTGRLPGGTVSCFTYTQSGAPAPAANGSYAFFLGASADSTGFTSAQLTLIDAWPVAADGTISTPLDGTLSTTAFLTNVQAAP
jgi:hypothetical protein